MPEEFDEKNVPTEQYQTEEDARLFGKDEHQEWPECLEAEAGKGKEETYRLISAPRERLGVLAEKPAGFTRSPGRSPAFEGGAGRRSSG